jgi:hypothetical protein
MVPLTEVEHACNAAQRIRPLGITSYVDKVQVWLETSLLPMKFHSLASHCRGGLHDVTHHHRKKWDRSGNYRQCLHLYQPTHKALQFLTTVHGARFNHLELALDWTFASKQDRDAAHAFVCKHHVKRWHGKQKLNFHEGITRYTSKKRKVPNNFIIYSDKPCRITGEVLCVHMEWRLTGARTLRRASIGSVRELLNLDLRQFWKQKFILRAVDHRALGRRYNIYLFEKGEQLGPWFGRFASNQTSAYDIDALVGAKLARRCGLTQAVIDRFRTSIDVGRCLVNIPVSHLLPR